MKPPTASPTSLRAFQLRVFWLLWGGYGSYYLCRVNFAVAQPVLLREFPDWTSAQIGTIPSLYAAVYAVGQIVNGTLGQRYGTRRMMTIAMLFAGLTNILFAFTSSFETMRLLWAVNGWFQSAGWSLMVGTLANWNTSARRGTLIGRLSTCYTVGNVASWLLAGFLCEAVGWRAAFLAPGLFMLPMAVVFFVFLRDTPQQAGFASVRDDVAHESAGQMPAAGADEHTATWTSTWEVVKLTLANRVLWILAIGFLVMNAVRYSFMNWTVQYMADFHGRSIRNSALTAIVVPLVGSLGALSAGWASDVLFGKRRAPVCIFMMLGLTMICGGMTFVPRGCWQAATCLLGLAGFMIYGPDMLMSGAATVDLSHPRAGAIATGLTMCFGALGAIFSGVGIGYLKDFAHGNWSLVFWVLAAMPLLPALLLTSLWNARPKTSR
ncbi:MAG: MFS transporter [Verrucomicrobia bacterium]|nr:MFS transporter [Verrucomicrobiota bacterium]